MTTLRMKISAVFMGIIFVLPTVFFVTPSHARADSNPGCYIGVAAGLASMVTNAFVSVNTGDAPTGVANWTTAGTEVGTCLYSLVIVPILKQMIRSMLQSMTKATVNWINGQNGTGQPSYVPDLPKHLQGVSDNAALSFISKISSGLLKSPFDTVISTALNQDYLQKTSLAGFFQANKSTLPGTTQSQKAFLSGDWNKGGISSWFALTTQSQNNPFQLFQNATGRLGGNVKQAETNRRQDLIQSGGFLSFCPGSAKKVAGSGANPQASCLNPDGTTAKTATPGSTISSYLQANVNSGIGQLVSAQDLDSAIGQIVSALASQVIGPSGLFGSSQSSGSSDTTPTTTASTTASQAVLGVVDSAIQNSALYNTAWKTILDSANVTTTSLNDLAKFCTDAATAAASEAYLATFIVDANAQATAAKQAITTIVNPIIADAQKAPVLTTATVAFAQKVKDAGLASPIADPIQFNADLAALATMSPLPSDVLTARTNATASNGAIANPKGSLTVGGGSLIDQLNLLQKNAAALKSSCVPPPPSMFPTGGGGV